MTAATFAFSLATLIIMPALAAIERETGASAVLASWLITAYLIASTIAVPFAGRLGDMLGKRQVLLWSLGLFALGCTICALGAGSIAALLAGRVLQGASAAVFPMSFGIVRDALPRERVAQSVALISGMYGVGGGIGLVVAGATVDRLGIAGMFWLSLVVALVAMRAVWRQVPESPRRVQASIDWLGGLLLSAALTSALLGISLGPGHGWFSAAVIGLVVGGMGLGVLFVGHERRVSDPMVDLGVLSERAVWVPNLAGVWLGFTMFGSYLLVVTLLTAPRGGAAGFGLDTRGVALMMFPASMATLVFSHVGGRIGARRGSYVALAIGVGLLVLANLLFAGLHGALWIVAGVTVILGAGTAFALAALPNLILEAVPPNHSGIATGINVIARNLGGALGTQAVATLLASGLGDDGRTSGVAFALAFCVCAATAAAAGAVCGLPRRGARDAAGVARQSVL
ncbi:MAG TPA: MFS transporter [Baekduia sp.]|nr:MFS transporter [Baekduia sp.]